VCIILFGDLKQYNPPNCHDMCYEEMLKGKKKYYVHLKYAFLKILLFLIIPLISKTMSCK